MSKAIWSGPLFIAADHAGFELKERLKKARPDLPWKDLGPQTADRVDYPDFGFKLATQISNSASPNESRGVLICGSGQGMMIAANRFAKVRAALAWIPEIAKLSRQHNNANVLCLASRFTTDDNALTLIDLFLETEFEGGRHGTRVDKLTTRPEC